MSIKHLLTNEKLNKRFESPFALVNYAIQLAKVQIKRGYDLDTNPANEVLELIVQGKDHLEDVEDLEDEDDEA